MANFPTEFDVSVSEVRGWAKQLADLSKTLNPAVEADVHKYRFYTLCTKLLIRFAELAEEAHVDDEEEEEEEELQITTPDKRMN